MAIVVGVALFAAIVDTLFIPSGPTTPPILVGIVSLAAVAMMVVGLFSGK